jgi:hypothetical protein
MTDDTKEFGTGAKRGATVAGQRGSVYPRFDLISMWGLLRLAETYGEGAARHGDDNWRNGMPGKDLMNRVLGHCAAYLRGDRTEDHLAHAAWGLFALMENEALRPELMGFWSPDGTKS